MNNNFRIKELKGTFKRCDFIMKHLLSPFYMLAIHTYHPVMDDSSGNTKMCKSQCPCPRSLQCIGETDIKIFCEIIEGINTSDLRKVHQRKLNGRSLKSGL